MKAAGRRDWRNLYPTSWDEAVSWIQVGDSFIHIRFCAVLQEDGTYEGCLEVAQDATHMWA